MTEDFIYEAACGAQRLRYGIIESTAAGAIAVALFARFYLQPDVILVLGRFGFVSSH